MNLFDRSFPHSPSMSLSPQRRCEVTLRGQRRAPQRCDLCRAGEMQEKLHNVTPFSRLCHANCTTTPCQFGLASAPGAANLRLSTKTSIPASPPRLSLLPPEGRFFKGEPRILGTQPRRPKNIQPDCTCSIFFAASERKWIVRINGHSVLGKSGSTGSGEQY